MTLLLSETPFPPSPRAGHEPGCKHRPAERTAGPGLLPVPAPEGMVWAQPLTPIPAGSAAGRHKAAGRAGSRRSHRYGEQSQQPCCSLLHCIFLKYMYMHIYKTAVALLWASHGMHPHGMPVGTLQHPGAAGKRPQMSPVCVIWVSKASEGLVSARASSQGSSKMLGAIPMQEPRLSCFPRGSSSHRAAWQTHLPSVPKPAAPPGPTTPWQKAQGCPKQPGDSAAQTSPPSSTVSPCRGPGPGTPRPGTPLQLRQRRLKQPAPSKAGTS